MFPQGKEGDNKDRKHESKSYQQLVDFLLADQVKINFIVSFFLTKEMNKKQCRSQVVQGCMILLVMSLEVYWQILFCDFAVT